MPAGGPEGDPGDEGEEGALYRLPPDQFTAARDALASKLRQRGDREGAARVKALKKPTTIGWAVNKLAADHPAQVAALLEAGAQVKTAHKEALAGLGAEALREAVAAERDAMGALLDRVEPEGRAAREKVRATLLAASHGTDEEREMLRAGRVTREMSAAGFGEGPLEAPVLGREPLPPRSRPRGTVERDETRRRLAAERQEKRLRQVTDWQEKQRRLAAGREEALRQATAQREEEQRRVALELEEKRRLVQEERARKQLEIQLRQAESRLEQAVRLATSAEQRAAEARARASEAAAEVEQLRQQLHTLQP